MKIKRYEDEEESKLERNNFGNDLFSASEKEAFKRLFHNFSFT